MPIYDFQCPSCGDKFERLTHAETKQVECKCGELASRLISSPWLKIDINSDRWVNRHKTRGKR